MADYGVSKYLLQQIEGYLNREQYTDVLRLLYDLHAADIADICYLVNNKQRKQLFTCLKGNFDPQILIELDTSLVEDLIESLGIEDAASALQHLLIDDALAVLEELQPELRQELLQLIDEPQKELFIKALTYQEDSAARLMQQAAVCGREFWTVFQAKEYIKAHVTSIEPFYDILIVDKHKRFLGTVPLSRLLQSKERDTLQAIMNNKVKVLRANTPIDEVAFAFRQYGLVSVPVLSDKDHVMGVITIDDAVELVDQDTSKELMHLVGGVDAVDLNIGIFSTAYTRWRWLIVTFFDTILASSVLYQFQATLDRIVALAILMPIVAAMGGNAGMQTVTVVVRGLSTHQLQNFSLRRLVTKELSVGLLNGLFFAIVLSLLSSWWFKAPSLGIVLGAAMIFNMSWGCVVGAIFPIMLDKLGFDPAVSAGPFLCTTTDVLGFAVFLGLATLFLL